MPDAMSVVSGVAAEALIATMLSQHEGGVSSTLGRYDRRSAVSAWHEVLRGVDEFLNILWFGIDPGPDKTWLLACPLDGQILMDPQRMPRLLEIVGRRYDAAVVHRFRRTVVQLAETDRTFKERGIQPMGLPNGIDTLETGGAYLQSRRRHLVSLFYAMPSSCAGRMSLETVLALPTLACLVEHCCATLTGLHQKRLLMNVHPDFTLTETPWGYVGNHEFEELERHFLEAERVSIFAMTQERPDMVAPFRLEDQPADEVFSAQELRNNVRALAAAYAAFGDDPGFAAMSRVIIALSRRCEDDYFVRLDRTELETLIANQLVLPADKMMDWMVAGPGSYAEQTNRHHPFVEIDGRLEGDVVLLSRFLNAFKNLHLASQRRFVIHSGFIFEDMVKRDLATMGFDVKPIKRVGRREFDVIAVRGDTIFNLQCKNNALDLSQLEAQPRRVAAANRRLLAYYRGALRKERARQGILQAELGLTKIRHFVVSRFPVITTNPAIIPFNALARLEQDDDLP